MYIIDIFLLLPSRSKNSITSLKSFSLRLVARTNAVLNCGQPHSTVRSAPCHLICRKTYPRKHIITYSVSISRWRGVCMSMSSKSASAQREENPMTVVGFVFFFIYIRVLFLFLLLLTQSVSVLVLSCYVHFLQFFYTAIFFFGGLSGFIRYKYSSTFSCIYIFAQQRFCPFNFIIIILGSYHRAEQWQPKSLWANWHLE